MTYDEAVTILRRYQRHHVLRQYGTDGSVLPDCLEVSRAIDEVITGSRNIAIEQHDC